MTRLAVLLVVAVLAAPACAPEDARPADPSPQVAPDPAEASSAGSPAATPTPTTPGTPSATPSAVPSAAATRTPRPGRPADPRWRFFTDDRTQYASPWFPGRHPVMIPFGCTPAPYYSPDPSCPDGRGFHHGIDVAISCGTPLRAGRPATVLDHGALGPAYGDNPVLLRAAGFDVVVGHTERVFVAPGDSIPEGEVFARVSDRGAPDGCHLHFEVRRPGGEVTDAVDPAPLLDLRP
ncbi:M23 family metallopeptidase [Nocardioides guangzhouensis]|uniref:M23 family metallopeptidase n=1 Tax=Nocardioides guangzhouensis TaxID=2497878 RepID=A0A4V1Y036_9ACTN|nr:M23 family metallopeptidase [Nocardioides guangzhouensis]RYP88879.1 M23 family metallopeptidase [Nocardioides guangzhouensis]